MSIEPKKKVDPRLLAQAIVEKIATLHRHIRTYEGVINLDRQEIEEWKTVEQMLANKSLTEEEKRKLYKELTGIVISD